MLWITIPETTSAATILSYRNTKVFRMALMGHMESRTLWQKLTHIPSARQQVALHTFLVYLPSRMWCHIRTIGTRCVLHLLQGLQLSSSRLHDAWRWLCLSPAQCHMLPLHYCDISDATLSPYWFSSESLSLIAMQCWLRIRRLPLHLLRHYRILQVSNILCIFHTL